MVAGNGLFSHQKTWRTQEWHPGHVRPFHLSLVYLLCEFFFYHRRLRWLRPPRINMSDSLPTHSLVHMFFATRWGFQHLGPWSPHGISTECKFLRHQTQSFQSIAKRNSRYRNLLFVSITFGTLCQLTWATASFFFFHKYFLSWTLEFIHDFAGIVTFVRLWVVTPWLSESTPVFMRLGTCSRFGSAPPLWRTHSSRSIWAEFYFNTGSSHRLKIICKL